MIVLLIVSVALAGVGLLLLVQGVRPRRVGDAPHCARCNYSLIGNESGTCPECGADLSLPKSVVYGQRRPRVGRIFAGSMMLTVVLLGGYFVFARNFDPYTLKPTGWVVSDVESGGAIVGRAWTELQRRMKDSPLGPGHRSRMIDVALKEQAKAGGGPFRQQMLDFLGMCAKDDQLSESQKKTFVDQIVSTQMSVRPSVRLGDPMMYSVRYRGAAPTGGWWCNLETLEVLLDGTVVQKGGGSSGFSGSGASGSTGSSVPSKSLGKHTITVRERLRVYPRAPGGNREQGVYAERVIEHAGVAEVVPKEGAPALKRLDGDELAAKVRGALAPQSFTLGESTPGVLTGQFKITSAPAPLAFDVAVRFEGKEYAFGTISSVAGGSTNYHISGWNNKYATVPDRITVVLRSSEAVARRTVDLAEYFDGEITFEDVPVTLGPKGGAAVDPSK